MMMGRRLIIPFTLLILLMASACGPARRAPEPLDAGDQALPGTIAELVHEAESSFDRCGPVDAVQRSLAATEVALASVPDHPEASLHAARAAAWLLEFDESLDPAAKRDLAGRGVGYAETALAAGGESVETVFLVGALLGLQLEAARVPLAPGKLGRVHEHFERAVELDPSFSDGAPLRALGTLLVKAPSWPAGPGDVERGVELLTRAVLEHRDDPANHYYLGEALLADGQRDQALASLQRVIDICARYDCDAVCRLYTARVRAILP